MRFGLGRTLALGCLLACAAAAQDLIHFQRNFPGAVPERFEVSLRSDGAATYTEAGEEPLELMVGAAEVAPLFDRAAGLDYFSKPLASKRRVASTGKKVLRYESRGQVRGEAAFDYSDVREAREVASWFVKLAETQQHLQSLERAYRFDRLGVNDALVRLEQAYERDRVAATGLLVPVLTRIAGHERLVHLARARAQGLLERIAQRARER